MFDSAILDVAIGIAFVYVLVSTLCTAVREAIESRLKTRAAYLEYSIREMLNDRSGQGLASSLFKHPLIQGLYHGDYKPGHNGPKPTLLQQGDNLPSYIPSQNFALALIDLAAHGQIDDATSGARSTEPVTLDSLRKSVSKLENPRVERAVLAALDAAQNDINRMRLCLEAWYDGGMDRVSGWYKRSTQTIIFGIALVVVFALNLNTITIAEHLYRDPSIRKAAVAAAERATLQPTAAVAKAASDALTQAPSTGKSDEPAAADTPASGDKTAVGNQPAAKANAYEAISEQFSTLHLPIGWADGWRGKDRTGKDFNLWQDVLCPLLGLLMTAFAATLGAPFWFDVLNKFMVIRATVKPREKSQEEGSEDRQPRNPQFSGNWQYPSTAPMTLPVVMLSAPPANAPPSAAGSSS